MALASSPPMWYGGPVWHFQKKWGNGKNNSSTPSRRKARTRTGTGTTSEKRNTEIVTSPARAYFDSAAGKKELEFLTARRKAGLPYRPYVLL